MAITIQGVRLGDIREEHCSLFSAVDRFCELYTGIESLWHEAFNGLSDAEIFDIIDRALYTGEPDESRWEYLPFDFLNNTGEMFDTCKTFIVRRSGRLVHILYQQFRDDTRGSASCSVDSFQRVAANFVRWFNAQVPAIARHRDDIQPESSL